MKTKQIKGKVDILLVDVNQEIFNAKIHGCNLFIQKCPQCLWDKYIISDDLLPVNWKLISTIENLTEEKIKINELVETKPYGSHPFFCTLDYMRKGKNKNGFNPGYCADTGEQYTSSFHSLLKANDVLLSNPLGDYSAAHKRHILNGQWQEAEAKVFNPKTTLIFVKQ